MANILVIDDDEAVRDMVKSILAVGGHTVLFAADGRSGMQRMTEGKIDLIITDIIMPDQEGIETIQQLRRLGAKLPILAISGGGQRGHADFLSVARELGATDTLAKPFRAKDLIAKITTLLGGNTNAAA